MVQEEKDFVLDEIAIFEWYDGMVRGIGVAGKLHYLLTMVAWDPEATRKRVYLMIELEPAKANEMKLLSEWKDKDEQQLDKDWARLNELCLESIAGYDGPVYCLAGEPKTGKEFSAKTVAAEHLSELMNYDIMQAFQPVAQQFWFNQQ